MQQVRRLSDSDAELQRLAPDEAILDASVPPLPLEQIVRTPGPATATGPALGERAYDLRLDPASGRRYREFSGPKISRFTATGGRAMSNASRTTLSTSMAAARPARSACWRSRVGLAGEVGPRPRAHGASVTVLWDVRVNS